MDHRVAIRRNVILIILALILQAAAATAIICAEPETIPHHHSPFDGQPWIRRLLNGRSQHIRTRLGMRKDVFLELVEALRTSGLESSRSATLEEQVAIFLYICVTGLPIRLVGERFQRSKAFISKSFNNVLEALSSAPLTDFIRSPNAESPPSPAIANQPKPFPFFEDALGAICGTHINCIQTERDPFKNHNGTVIPNFLAACSFGLKFLHIFRGWEGSTSESTMYNAAHLSNLVIPPGKYYLTEGDFPSCDGLLVPYCGAQCRPTDQRPQTPEELFNSRHLMARKIVERIYVILKRRFRILSQSPHHDLDTRARIPVALATLHNFIRDRDPDEIHEFSDSSTGPVPCMRSSGQLAVGVSERNRASRRRDDIARRMWGQYQENTQGKT